MMGENLFLLGERRQMLSENKNSLGGSSVFALWLLAKPSAEVTCSALLGECLRGLVV